MTVGHRRALPRNCSNDFDRAADFGTPTRAPQGNPASLFVIMQTLRPKNLIPLVFVINILSLKVILQLDSLGLFQRCKSLQPGARGRAVRQTITEPACRVAGPAI